MNSAGVRRLKILLGLATTAGFAWLLVRGLDLDALGQTFTRVSIPAVLFALVFLPAGWAMRIVRWWWMLRTFEPTLPLGACVGPFLAGAAVNNVLPLRAGDALRVLGFRRQLRSPAMRVAGTLVIERALDVSVLVGVFFVGLLGLPEGVFPHGFVVTVTWLAGAGGAFLLVLLFLPVFNCLQALLSTRFLSRSQNAVRSRTESFQPGRWFHSGRCWPQAVYRHCVHLADALRLVYSGPKILVLIGLSIVSWVCEGAVFVAVAAAILPGAAPMGPWFALATGTLATAIPSTSGHIGTFDYFAAQGLAAYGAAPEVAAAFALTVHAVLWTTSTAAGLSCLLVRGVRPRHMLGRISSDSNGDRVTPWQPT